MDVSVGEHLGWCKNCKQAVWVPLMEEQLATVTHCWAGCFSLLEIGEWRIYMVLLRRRLWELAMTQTLWTTDKCALLHCCNLTPLEAQA